MLNLLIGFVLGIIFVMFLSLAAAAKDSLSDSGLEYRKWKYEEDTDKIPNSEP